MSFDGFAAAADAELAARVVAVLRAGMAVRDVLGEPARVFDGEAPLGEWPFVTLERHDVKPGDSVSHVRHEHRLQFAVSSRYGGLSEAKAILGALRASVEAVDWTAELFAAQRIVLALVTYSDVMRTRDRRAFRGVFRMKLITEVVDA